MQRGEISGPRYRVSEISSIKSLLNRPHAIIPGTNRRAFECCSPATLAARNQRWAPCTGGACTGSWPVERESKPLKAAGRG